MNANVMSINRLRMWTDGNGVTTLVTFYGCPLKCKYCLNEECHDSSKLSIMSASELYEEIKIDQLYFLATGGGLTFGGGEPLLNAEFIKEVLQLGADKWHTTIETSLNVPFDKWECIAEYVDEFIIDIKDMNPIIYKTYSGVTNDFVIKNLKMLEAKGLADRTLIRLPLIDSYNSQTDIDKSRQQLESMGFSNFNEFKYIFNNSSLKI